MKTGIIALLSLLLLLAACGQETNYVCPDGTVVASPSLCETEEQSTEKPEPSEPEEEAVEEPVVQEELSEEQPTTEDAEKQDTEQDGRWLESPECDSDLLPHQVKSIKLDVEEQPLERTDEGFYLQVYPMTEEGEVVPVTTSINVIVYRTYEYQDSPQSEPRREMEGREIYKASFYRKKENARSDCAPKKVFIPFEDYNELLLKKTEDGDPGGVIVKAKIGSEEFQKVYQPYLKDESVMP